MQGDIRVASSRHPSFLDGSKVMKMMSGAATVFLCAWNFEHHPRAIEKLHVLGASECQITDDKPIEGIWTTSDSEFHYQV